MASATQLNLSNLFYILFRLFPIILPSYFMLSSVFSQDIKGVLYVAGLLISCFITMLVGNSTGFVTDNKSVCHILSLGDSEPMSRLPLSTTIYAYTFAFLFYVIAKYSLYSQNLPTLFFLPMLVIADVLWNLMNGCNNASGLGLSFGIGLTVGLAWASLIDSAKLTKLQYFNGLSNRTYCTQAKNASFKCSDS